VNDLRSLPPQQGQRRIYAQVRSLHSLRKAYSQRYQDRMLPSDTVLVHQAINFMRRQLASDVRVANKLEKLITQQGTHTCK